MFTVKCTKTKQSGSSHKWSTFIYRVIPSLVLIVPDFLTFTLQNDLWWFVEEFLTTCLKICLVSSFKFKYKLLVHQFNKKKCSVSNLCAMLDLSILNKLLSTWHSLKLFLNLFLGRPPAAPKSYDYLLKVLLVGDSDVGKQEILQDLEDGSADSPFCSGSGKLILLCIQYL